MTEHKFTDGEIIRALECCRDFGDCSLCPYAGATFEDEPDCAEKMHTDALDLINRQNANLQEVITLNSKLEAELAELQSEIKILKDSNINLQELYQTEREKVAKAKQKVIDIAKALQSARAEAIKEFCKKRGIEYVEDDV